MRKIKFSLFASIILVLSSFIPVLQILLLTANGAFLSLFTNADNKIILIVNAVASLLMFILFYFSKTTIAKVFCVLGILLFFIPFLFYTTENVINTDKYYFLQILIIGVVTSILLIITETIQTKATD